MIPNNTNCKCISTVLSPPTHSCHLLLTARISHMTSAVVPPSSLQKLKNASRYALYSVLRIISMFISSKSCSLMQSTKKGAETRYVQQLHLQPLNLLNYCLQPFSNSKSHSRLFLVVTVLEVWYWTSFWPVLFSVPVTKFSPSVYKIFWAVFFHIYFNPNLKAGNYCNT